MEEARRVLQAHLAAYPGMTVQDAVKLLYQNEFGPGHMIPDPEAALRCLEEELAGVTAADAPACTPIGNGLARLELAVAKDRLTPETLCRMFVLTAETQKGSRARFAEKLSLLRELPFDQTETERFLAAYAAAGYPAQHHSGRYRAVYHPAYRVVLEIFSQYFDLFAAIDRQMAKTGRALVAIDGRCAAGKTTLAAALATVYDCPVFHLDNFFLPAEKRTPARLAEPGGNVDRERFLEEVLLPFSQGKDVTFRPFDCHKMDFGPPVTVPHGSLAVFEGSYSLHPALRARYTLPVFLTLSPEAQLARITDREGAAGVPAFRDRWIPLEERYFAALGPEAYAQLVFSGP